MLTAHAASGAAFDPAAFGALATIRGPCDGTYASDGCAGRGLAGAACAGALSPVTAITAAARMAAALFMFVNVPFSLSNGGNCPQ
jgi:hypothetical protein